MAEHVHSENLWCKYVCHHKVMQKWVDVVTSKHSSSKKSVLIFLNIRVNRPSVGQCTGKTAVHRS